MGIFNLSLRFDDFTSEQSFIRLQNTFLSKDFFSGNSFPELLEPQNEIKIKAVSLLQNMDGQELDFIEISFIKDFLEVEIQNISSTYIRHFQKEIEDKNALVAEAKSTLTKKYLAFFNTCNAKINSAKYLSENIKNLLKLELDKAIDSIESFLINQYPNVKTKIPFNLIQTHLIYFFYALREKKIIHPNISNADLGRIIDNMCECLGEEPKDKKPKKFVSIYLSKKYISDFNRQSERPQGPSIDKLKKELDSLLDNL